jgi:hypothetical protein
MSKPSSSMPKASAMLRTLSSPRSMPSWAKAVLQEMVSASMSGWSAAAVAALAVVVLQRGAGARQGEQSGAGIVVSGV